MGIPGIGSTSCKALALKVGIREGLLTTTNTENGDELLAVVPNFAEQLAYVAFEKMLAQRMLLVSCYVNVELSTLAKAKNPLLVILESNNEIPFTRS